MKLAILIFSCCSVWVTVDSFEFVLRGHTLFRASGIGLERDCDNLGDGCIENELGLNLAEKFKPEYVMTNTRVGLNGSTLELKDHGFSILNDGNLKEVELPPGWRVTDVMAMPALKLIVATGAKIQKFSYTQMLFYFNEHGHRLSNDSLSTLYGKASALRQLIYTNGRLIAHLWEPVGIGYGLSTFHEATISKSFNKFKLELKPEPFFKKPMGGIETQSKRFIAEQNDEELTLISMTTGDFWSFNFPKESHLPHR